MCIFMDRKGIPMNRNHRIARLALCILALVLVFAGCQKKDADARKDHLTRIREAGVLVIATEGNWSPWTYHDEKDALTGFDIEIGTLLAEGLGVTPKFEETEWSAILAGVDAGRFDIACNGVGYTPERAEKYNFSTPYVYTPKVLVVRSDNEDIHTLADLKGRTTANSPNSTYANLAEENGATVTSIDTLDQTIELLLQGRVDATINAKGSIDDYLAQHPGAAIKIALTLEGDPVVFPVSKGADSESLMAEIDRILGELRASGKLQELSLKYFGEDLTNP